MLSDLLGALAYKSAMEISWHVMIGFCTAISSVPRFAYHCRWKFVSVYEKRTMEPSTPPSRLWQGRERDGVVERQIKQLADLISALSFTTMSSPMGKRVQ